MKGVGRTAVSVSCGLPSILFMIVTTVDQFRGMHTFTGPQMHDLIIFLGLLAGPGEVILFPAMWIAFLSVRSTLSRSARWTLTGFVMLSTLGVVNFWTQFFN